MTSNSIQLTDVTLRDGLQSESVTLTTDQKLSLFQLLLPCGFSRIELTSFSHPKWIPQLSDSQAFCEKVFKLESIKKHPATEWMAFVPNQKGLERFLNFPIHWASLFLATSETFHQKNVNLTLSEGFKQVAMLVENLKKSQRKTRVYLSTVFGCPYEKDIPLSQVEFCLSQIAEVAPDEIALSDTLGVASPSRVEAVLHLAQSFFPKEKIALHLHNTYGLALSNISKAISLGITQFDGSVGGLGGCPYAQGASGNVGSEEIAYLLERERLSFSLQWDSLFQVFSFLEKEGVSLSSKIAGLKKKGGQIYGISSRIA